MKKTKIASPQLIITYLTLNYYPKLPYEGFPFLGKTSVNEARSLLASSTVSLFLHWFNMFFLASSGCLWKASCTPQDTFRGFRLNTWLVTSGTFEAATSFNI